MVLLVIPVVTATMPAVGARSLKAAISRMQVVAPPLPANGRAQELVMAVVQHPAVGATVHFRAAGPGCGALVISQAPVGLVSISQEPPVYAAEVLYTASSAPGPCTFTATEQPDHLMATVTMVEPADDGYWVVSASGQVRAFGHASLDPPFGAPASVPGTPLAGLAAAPGPTGYWLLTRRGEVIPRGSVASLGGIPARMMRGTHAVGLAPTPSGLGYWILLADGRVAAIGDAPRLGGVPITAGSSDQAVGLAADPSGHGYWIATRNGHVFARGNAPDLGSPYSRRYRSDLGHTPNPVVAIVGGWSRPGYWVVTAVGQVFGFGAAPDRTGSCIARSAGSPVVGAAGGAFVNGGWLLTADGHVYPCGPGPVPFYGSPGARGQTLGRLVGIAASPSAAAAPRSPTLCAARDLSFQTQPSGAWSLIRTSLTPCAIVDTPNFLVTVTDGSTYPVSTDQLGPEVSPYLMPLPTGPAFELNHSFSGYLATGAGIPVPILSCPASVRLSLALPNLSMPLTSGFDGFPICDDARNLTIQYNTGA